WRGPSFQGAHHEFPDLAERHERSVGRPQHHLQQHRQRQQHRLQGLARRVRRRVRGHRARPVQQHHRRRRAPAARGPAVRPGQRRLHRQVAGHGAHRRGLLHPVGQRRHHLFARRQLRRRPRGLRGQPGRMSDLRLATGDAPPRATEHVSLGLNLPGNAVPPTATPFDANDPESYNHTTSVTVYDSLGAPHSQSMYFVRTANPNEWQVYTRIDGVDVGGPQTLQYSNAGTLVSPANGEIPLPTHTIPGGAAALDLTLDLERSTQYGDRFGVSALIQDGHSTGRLSSIEVSAEGVVAARYSNGVSTPLGQVALTNFANPQGLQPVGDNAGAETHGSGLARRGAAGTAEFGMVQGGALEGS